MQNDRSVTDGPTVSVGIPVFNGERTLLQAVESFLGQTMTDLEIIISDNASTDATREVARQLTARDDRVRYSRNDENIGVSGNYNKVFSLARGRYFKWASASDYCDITMLEKCVRALDEWDDAVLCFPMTRLVYDDDRIEDYPEPLELDDDSPCLRLQKAMEGIRLNNKLNGVIRTSILRQTKPHGAYLHSDMPLMAELALRGKFLRLPDFLLYRRMDAVSATKLMTLRQRERYFKPQSRTPLRFQNWKLAAGFVDRARRVPLPLKEKLCAYRFLARYLIWSRKDLLEDITLPIRRRVS